MRVSISVVGFTPISGIWNTQKTLEPIEETQSFTRLLRPVMTDEMVMTVVTPMMTIPLDGEPGAKLVGSHGIESHLDRFARLSPCHVVPDFLRPAASSECA